MRVRDFSDRSDPGVLVEEDVTADDRVEGHSPSADLLASGYALQLENLGLLQEAVFVLLHIEGSAGYVVVFYLHDPTDTAIGVRRLSRTYWLDRL